MYDINSFSQKDYNYLSCDTGNYDGKYITNRLIDLNSKHANIISDYPGSYLPTVSELEMLFSD